jgi:hypothetical protein
VAHDDGDDVVVIMCASDQCDERDCVHSRDGSKVHRVDTERSASIASCSHSQDRMTSLAVELSGC